jgi:ParB-like chromosome segregation protein Spo0J
MTERKMRVERVRVSSVRENPLNGEIFNDVPAEKYAALKDYIQRTGLLKPIILNGENIILAGHIRFRICKELGHKTIPIQRVRFSDAKKETELLIKDNLLTRALTPIEIAKAGIHLEGIAQKWKRDGKILRDEIARQLGISSSQYGNIKAILSSGNSDLVGRVNRGELSVARAYSILRQEREKAKVQEKAVAEEPRFRLVNEDPMSVLSNFRPGSCDAIVVEPPNDCDPLLMDLAARALKPTGHLAVITEKNFKAIATAQDVGLNLIVNVCMLGRSHEEGKIIRNNRLFVWLSHNARPRIKADRLSTTWDFRMQEDAEYESMKRILHLLVDPGAVVVHLFGSNQVMEKLAPVIQCHVFAVQPNKDSFVREKLRV